MVSVGLFGVDAVRAAGPVEYPGPAPGEARASIKDGVIILDNDVLQCTWTFGDGHLKRIHSIKAKNKPDYDLELELWQQFLLVMADRETLTVSNLDIIRGPDIETLAPDPKAQRLAARAGGKRIRMSLVTADANLTVRWSVEMRDGSNYVRQYLSLRPKTTDVDLREIVFIEARATQPAGTLDGSPIISSNSDVAAPAFFLAFEHPLSKTQVMPSSALRCSLPRGTPLKAGEEQTYSSVTGVAPAGQLRRAFLYYVERERAQPYRPFLHYNSWYDLGYGLGKILEPDALEVVDLFGKELVEQRHVVMDSFVPDDGWDDPASLWRFHEGFPHGFAPLQQRAARYKSGIGAWLSPWGGYGKAKEERMKYGQQEGFEMNKNGFSMAGPKYYARFRDACLGMIRDYQLNYFKFDGISSGGAPTGAAAGYEPDVEALLCLIGDLRKAKPDLFINVTTGTWSSPYWLWYADSTWRSGADWDMCGWGSKRQQQITYRDAQTWQNVVSRAPLYPINSLMTQGIMFANHGLRDEAADMVEDIHAFFASGTNCQELYITPSLLDAQTWDVLAEAANWSRENADVLVDTHWIGGSPAQGEVYGWASWSKRKGVLALRNPTEHPGRIAIDIGKAFELPEGAARKYSLRSPWKSDAPVEEIQLSAGTEHSFELKPFEVLVFDAMPLGAK
jgi:hypothetical protein